MGNKKKQRQKREQKRSRVENHGTAANGASHGQTSSDQDPEQDHQDEAGPGSGGAAQSQCQAMGAESLEPHEQDNGPKSPGHVGTGDSEFDHDSADEKEDYVSCEEDPDGVDSKGLGGASGSPTDSGSHDTGERPDQQAVSEAAESKSVTKIDQAHPGQDAPSTAVKVHSHGPGDTQGDVHGDEEAEQDCRYSGDSEFTTPEECLDPNCNNSNDTEAKPERKCKDCCKADDLRQLHGDSLTGKEVQNKDNGESIDKSKPGEMKESQQGDSEDTGTKIKQNPPEVEESKNVNDRSCKQKSIDASDYDNHAEEEENSELSSDSEATNNADNSDFKYKIDDGNFMKYKLYSGSDDEKLDDEETKETSVEEKAGDGVDEEGFTKVKGKKAKKGKKTRSKDLFGKKIAAAGPQNANLMFYRGKIRSKPDDMFIDDIHRDWYDDMELLEYKHGYIQWLFPISEGKGMNYQAQALQPHEAEELREDKQAMERFMKSYQMMLNFYGMKLADRETGRVERADNWRERFRNLNYSSHNHLRVTRILKCLGELGLERYKYPLLEFLVHEVLETRELWSAVDSCRDYWIHTLADPAQREELFALAVELEFQAERQYRERERAKQGHVEEKLHNGIGNECPHDENWPEDKFEEDTATQAPNDADNHPQDEKPDIPGPEEQARDTQELEAKMRSLSLDDDSEEQREQHPQQQGQESSEDLSANREENSSAPSDRLLAGAAPQDEAYDAPSSSQGQGQGQAEEEATTDVFYQPDTGHPSDGSPVHIGSGTRIPLLSTSGASQNYIATHVQGAQNPDYALDSSFSGQNCFSGDGWDSSGQYGYGGGFSLHGYAQGVGSGDLCAQPLPQWGAGFPALWPHQDPGVWFGDVNSPLSEAYETRLPHRVSCTRVYGTRGTPTYYLETVYLYPSRGSGRPGHRGCSSAFRRDQYAAHARGHRSGPPSHFGLRGRGRGSGTSHYYRVRPY